MGVYSFAFGGDSFDLFLRCREREERESVMGFFVFELNVYVFKYNFLCQRS